MSKINILIPLGGKSPLFENQYFPKPLFEINNRLMIEYPISFFKNIDIETKFIFVLREEDCDKFHLDKTLKLLTNDNTVIIQQKSDTKGAICSCLLAIDSIDNDTPLIISNGDQFIERNCNEILDEFTKDDVDGGLVCFNSVHPQWSYAKLDANDNIIQTAEKVPISKNAIAGFYYFKKGSDFIESAQKSIENEAHVNNIYYTSPVYNEMILTGKKLKAITIDDDYYHSFYSFPKIREFEKKQISIN